MIKNSLALFVSILMIACSKKSEPPIKKIIKEIIIAPEYFLQLKSTDIYIGIRYFKDYEDKDLVTVTLNGKNGTVLSETSEAINGTNLLFKLPAIDQPGDYKIKCIVKNDQNSLAKEIVLRVINDYFINTVWNSLDKAYVSAFKFYAERDHNFNYTLIYPSSSLTNTSFDKQLGIYFDNGTLLKLNRLFIPGIYGRYTAKFNGSILEEISVTSGNPNIDKDFSLPKYYGDLTATYGPYVSQSTNYNGKTTIFKDGAYTIMAIDQSTIYTLIRK